VAPPGNQAVTEKTNINLYHSENPVYSPKALVKRKKYSCSKKSIFFPFRPIRKLQGAYPIAARYSARGCKKGPSKRSLTRPHSPCFDLSEEASAFVPEGFIFFLPMIRTQIESSTSLPLP